MSNKSLEKMSVEELEKYMDEHEDNQEEWEKAFSIYNRKADWKDLPDDDEEAALVLEQVIREREGL